MDCVLTRVAIRYENDVVLARQRARQIAALVGFDSHDQVRIATAVSELARNAFRYAAQGKVEFRLSDSAPPRFEIQVTDKGSGIDNLKDILNGRYISRTGMGQGILGARRLMDSFDISSSRENGTRVVTAKNLPPRAPAIDDRLVAHLSGQLAANSSQDPFEELQRQNQELLSTLEELQKRQTELAELNKELQDTNRGVVALYAELDERADFLRRASELKTQFLSNMTHEFRTPVNSILSLSRMLLDRMDGELNAEQERQVKFIQKAANGLSELVNDLLDLAKVEAGKVSIRPAEFSIQDLFGALRGMLRPLLANNSAITLVFEDPNDLPQLHTDESKISQILRNLISNALKYTDRGEIRVSASSERAGWMSLAVADTGIGIAVADQERIFEEFTQVEGPHQKGKPGTGLGLPLSRKLAELLGGRLTVKSESGMGSIFTLHVPVRHEEAPETTIAPELSTELDPARLPILIVEDNRETLFTYDKYLRGSGFQPLPARTLKQAREALKQFQPVAIILDVLLAQESTWAFLVELKQDPGTKQIPLLVVTMIENENKAKALGADAFHMKPLDRGWLLEQLAERVPQARRREVLLVDDDDASRYLLSGFLVGTPFLAVEAGTGREGLTLARKRKPAAIFLDLIMPDMNGFQVLEHLKADPETRSIPVVVHTAKLLTAQERERLKGQVLEVIPKDHRDRPAFSKQIREALLRAENPAATPTLSQAAHD